MGVSYWETGQRQKAVELTQKGIKWMEQAVKQGTLDRLRPGHPLQQPRRHAPQARLRRTGRPLPGNGQPGEEGEAEVVESG